jgi:hypothetical protein
MDMELVGGGGQRQRCVSAEYEVAMRLELTAPGAGTGKGTDGCLVWFQGME